MQAGPASLRPLLDVTLSFWLLDAKRTSGSRQPPAGDELLEQCFTAPSVADILCMDSIWVLSEGGDWP